MDIVVDASLLARNKNLVQTSRIWVAGIIGACAGILGLSGLNGFIFYFIFSFVVLSFLILLRVKFDVKETLINYSPLWKEGLTQGVSTFVLIWT